jgi:EAL domain-containing protein (putative c-di-GMP-specific phosphodiesterase class I)/PAS domain-containing protein
METPKLIDRRPGRGARAKALVRLLRSRAVSVAVAAASVLVLGGLLTATIVWTLYDPKWIAFLGGMLFAALVATASGASRAQWRIARRTLQLERTRERLELESKRARVATDGLRAAEERLCALCDALPLPLLYIDRELRCHYHNPAAELDLARSQQEIDSRPLSEVVGAQAYAEMQPFLAESLLGREAAYDLAWRADDGAEKSFSVRHVPYPPGQTIASGLYLILLPRAARPPVEAAPAAGEAPAREPEADDPQRKLVEAMRDNQFLLLAQPIRALQPQPGEPRFHEILLRLKEEEDNLLPPGGFFPTAERYGMMEHLDRWVVRHVINACHEAAGADGGPAALHGVNLSHAAVHSHAFARFVQKQIVDRAFDGRALCFEIAEPDIERFPADVARLMGMLKPLGVRFTADAFGSIHGAPETLRGLAFDFVKIDGVLIQRVARSGADELRVCGIAEACRKLGARSIAECVEDEATLARLRAIGVDYVQGFGIGRPAMLQAPRAALAA